MAREQARRIADAFMPAQRFGNRRDYYYTRGKLGSDPLFPGVLTALRGDTQPLLDIGCGLGLLAHVLRQDGQTMPYLGVDVDADKIARAVRADRRAGLTGTDFDCVDASAALPAHQGSVALLDVLQYLPAEAQPQLLANAAARVAPGGHLVIRTVLADNSGRDRTTRITDMLAHLVGWMGTRPRHYPDAASVRAPLEAAGLQLQMTPLYGNTPFNNWLFTATRG
ncbi:methyltransferase domain-containing protein [Stenotrophomonas sp. PS02289]|uniref:class I SAM-dependent methyltransferase n=1 Tax=Stenotrophomonas sp. PS02289 TaxID=2991422 RepID=UPI00249CE763|nr:methyltransferase domain-containing protein [Stenotrophomonas sp. PS02289]